MVLCKTYAYEGFIGEIIFTHKQWQYEYILNITCITKIAPHNCINELVTHPRCIPRKITKDIRQ